MFSRAQGTSPLGAGSRKSKRVGPLAGGNEWPRGFSGVGKGGGVRRGKIRSVRFGWRKKDGRGSEDGLPRATTLHPRGGGGIPPEPFGGNGSINRLEPEHSSLISVN